MQARILQPGDEALLAAAAKIGDLDPRGDEDRDPSPARCRALLTDPCFVAVVALEGGQPVGFIYGHVLPQMTRTALLIYSVDTDARHRRRGAARAMIEALRQLSLERGYYEMWVLTSAGNEPAMRLYETSGGVRETFDDVMWVFPLAP
jgi:aminoglycoside 3-N-acetyltransferase I